MTEETTMLTGIIHEEWRSISGNMDYKVSQIGRVRNVRTGLILKLRLNDTMGYIQIGFTNEHNRKICYVHRLVAQEFIENPENRSDVDHIDNNKQNNCSNNLRWASKSENQMNTIKRPSCSSIFKGVSWHTASRRWQVEIQTSTGKQNTVGYFSDETDAARAYNEKASELYCEFAKFYIL